MARWQHEMDLSSVKPEILKAYSIVESEIEGLLKKYPKKMPEEVHQHLRELLAKRVQIMRQFGVVKVKK